MTNHGFHSLMRERGIRVLTTDVGDRYVLEALLREGALLGGEQSGHVIYLRDHVTGDGLAAGLLRFITTGLAVTEMPECRIIVYTPANDETRARLPLTRTR